MTIKHTLLTSEQQVAVSVRRVAGQVGVTNGPLVMRLDGDGNVTYSNMAASHPFYAAFRRLGGVA